MRACVFERERERERGWAKVRLKNATRRSQRSVGWANWQHLLVPYSAYAPLLMDKL